MKKMLSMALALAMCLSLAACGSGSQSGSSSAAGSSSASQSGGSQSAGSASSQGEQEDTIADVQAVKDQGTLYVGITNFAPLDYKEEGSDEWIGFDADMAKLFAESLGVAVEFQEITWDYKVQELESKTIDCVWNGMTLTDEVLAAMGTSEPYCTNYQTLVFPADKAADFEGLTSLEGLNIAVESGSAGEKAAQELGATTVPVQSQANTLMEVASGTSDAAVIDVLMAAEMTGEGTSYANLAYSLNLNDLRAEESEFYGVGFRKGSDLVDAFNQFWAEKVADGTVLEVATTYGLQDAVVLD
ncbi:transporter substrate-binding domain-containing protein [Flavonifractor sp. An100]|uniref:transporter substrate-binding domain-containing protein n=1 Tax=Flavonifractor sp. An100 TaxID=1965538 RepID=UPI000B37143D|nr:transporter substrate-binding domain-containing protein [Flavonifractor sp. An100]OUQ77053.1 amino acid ABC transporter substrate-binding protein [Flavonifractor sp. An100]